MKNKKNKNQILCNKLELLDRSIPKPVFTYQQ